MKRTISKLAASQKHPGRYYAEFDTGEQLTVTVDQIADYSLFTGRSLEDEEFEALAADVSLAKAKAGALRSLGSRSLSRRQLSDKLTEKGTEQAVVEKTLDWLERIGAVNDEEYAAQIVRHYAGKGYGPSRIRDELFRRGIPRELWENAFSCMPETDETVFRLFCSRMRGAAPNSPEQTKTVNALQRRGYSWEDIRSALERYSSEWGEGNE